MRTLAGVLLHFIICDDTPPPDLLGKVHTVLYIFCNPYTCDCIAFSKH